MKPKTQIILIAVCAFVLLAAFIGVLVLYPVPEKLKDMPVTGTLPYEQVENTPTEETDPTPQQTENPINLTVVIDPGHGFGDPGTGLGLLENGLAEKDISLLYSQKLKDALKEKGIASVLTHEDNVIPADAEETPYLFSLRQRIDFTENLPDRGLFVSLHVDSYEADESVCGTRIYYNKSENTDADNFCGFLTENIDEAIGEKRARVFPMEGEDIYAVVQHITDIPSVLIEIGFVSNESDRNLMQSEEWQDRFVSSIADAIVEFLQNR